MELQELIIIALSLCLLIMVIIAILAVRKQNNILKDIQKELNKPYLDSIQKESNYYKIKK